jgi:hypothetical protein
MIPRKSKFHILVSVNDYCNVYVLVCAYMKTMWRCGYLDSKNVL